MAFLRSDFLFRRPNLNNGGASSSPSLLKFCWILIFLKACNAILLAHAPTFDILPPEDNNMRYKGPLLLSSSPGSSLENEETFNYNYDINNINMFRMRRNSNGPSQFRMNDFSRAFGRLHFGPLLRLRSISNRASPPSPAVKFVSSDPPRVKKALSYLSRFYPMFQSSPIISPQPLQTLKSPRRRLTATFSGESATFSSGRSHRPNLRLRWGK